MIPYLFAGFAGVLVVSGLLTILHKNAVTSALFLVLAFCSLAGIYLMLGAEFLGMTSRPACSSRCAAAWAGSRAACSRPRR